MQEFIYVVEYEFGDSRVFQGEHAAVMAATASDSGPMGPMAVYRHQLNRATGEYVALARVWSKV